MIVLDSSFLVAWYNQHDRNHAAARVVMTRFSGGEWGQGQLLDTVLAEVVTVLLARRGRKSALEASKRLLDAREVDLAYAADHFTTALELFRAQPERRLTFVDASVAALALHTDSPVACFGAGFGDIDGLSLVS